MDKMELATLGLLHSIPGIGQKTLWNIKHGFGSFQKCFQADAQSLFCSKISNQSVETLLAFRKTHDPMQILDQLNASEIKFCTIEDNQYPYLLSNIFDPPYIIYYYGKIEISQKLCVAVVGSRAATPYGKQQANRFGGELAERQITVVSGLARGIDTQAHLGSLEAKGNTIAVLGSGLDVIYPRENEKLFNQICNEGLVVSEFPVKTIPEPGNFPVRNRTISGLSRGVLVIEAKQKSGALITADFALEQGRDVMAVPGPISSKNSEGTNRLIKQGALVVTCIEDILEEYDMNVSKSSADHFHQNELFLLDNDESIIIECMGYEPMTFDEILSVTHLRIGELSSSLIKMEVGGLIKNLPGNYYVKL
ncbi:MAG: DNA-processing protein DprA [Bacillota bacterium]|nr:DNA-processing protein DprA [Bacillota bacterium]